MTRAMTDLQGDVTFADTGFQADGLARYPIDSREHAESSWSYINQPGNANKYEAGELRIVRSRIKSALRRFGVRTDPDRSNADNVSRSRLWAPPPTYDRTFRVTDIEISRARGDGREVEAYCAVFDQDAEIHDHQGHYLERIDSKAFNRQIGLGIDHVGVYYHHGMTIHGTPSDVYSVPIGRPLEIRPDGKGLRTLARYNDGPDVDRILEAINNGAIRGYSFRGPIYGSTPDRPARRKPGGPLPMVVRTALGLTEFGPTPTPAYESAGILAVRSATAFLETLSEDDRDLFKAEIIRILSPATRIEEEPDDPDVDVEEDDLEESDGDLEDDSETDDDQEATDATSDPEPGAVEDQSVQRNGHSDRLQVTRELLKREWNRKGDRRG
jgi:HK97 family phage prohead protease